MIVTIYNPLFQLQSGAYASFSDKIFFSQYFGSARTIWMSEALSEPLRFDISKLPRFLESLSPADFVLSTNDTSCEIHFIVIYTVSRKVRALFEEDMTTRSLHIPIDDPENYLSVFREVLYGHTERVSREVLPFLEKMVVLLECSTLVVQHDFTPSPSVKEKIIDVFQFLYDKVGNKPIKVIVNENEALATDMLIPSNMFPPRKWSSRTDTEYEVQIAGYQIAVTSFDIDFVNPVPRRCAIQGYSNGEWLVIHEFVFDEEDKNGKHVQINVLPYRYCSRLKVVQLAAFSGETVFALGKMKFYGYVRPESKPLIPFEQYAYIVA